MLARYLEARLERPSVRTVQEAPIPPGTAVPLSPEQRQVWLHAQLAPGIPLYNEPFTVLRHGPVDVAVLERSLTELVRRHDSWRTTFHVEDGQFLQRVHPPFDVQIPFLDFRPHPEEERTQLALNIAAEDAQMSFDLSRLPLFRCRLIRIAEDEYRLFVTCHHLIFDGLTGYQIFLPELATIYEAFAQGKSSPLPELPFQYADYAARRAAENGEADGKEDLSYWCEQLKPVPPRLQLPADRLAPSVPTFRGGMQPFAISAQLRDGLTRLSRQNGATLFATLLAALNVLLYRYSGQEDIVVGTVTAGRKMPGSERLMGFFLNTVAIRTSIARSSTFLDLLARVRNTCLQALAHDSVPIDLVLQHLPLNRDAGANPLFQVLLSMEPSSSAVTPGWEFSALDVPTSTAKYDLTMVLDDRGDSISGRLIYSTDLFEAATVERMLRCWITLLGSIVAAPDTPVSHLNILPAEECERLQQLGTAQGMQPKVESVLASLGCAAANSAGRTAVLCGSAQLTYAELERHSNQLAHRLISLGARPNDAVALCVERSVEMIVGILGILKAGAAYVPLDPSYPQERLSYMLQDCGARLVLTQSHLPVLPGTDQVRTVHLDLAHMGSETEPVSAPKVQSSMDDLAYIIYTSGSTGCPKGVEITHRNLACSTGARLDHYRPAGEVFLLLSSYSFDSSVAVIFHALCTGAALLVPSPETGTSPSQVVNIVRQNGVTDLLCVPSLYSEVLDIASPGELASLRRVIVAGESCPASLLETHFRMLPSTELYNEYGPTEATVWSTVYRCQSATAGNSVSIGHPIRGTQVFILDRNLELLPEGVPGELCIGGEGVARGYHNAPDLTVQRFVPNPFASYSGAKLYRTGDLARCLPDGNIEFMGRLDQQVKIRGLRIEPEEIEATLASHPDVRDNAVIVHGEETGQPQLIAHVVPRQQDDTSEVELRAFLQRRLPAYMIPSTFILCTSLPRSANGKTDRQALRRMQHGEISDSREPARPRSYMESRLLAIWQDVLGLQAVDIDQDFFALGGHSLLAAKLLDRIERETSQTLSLAFIFQAPTVRLMAESLQSPDLSLRSRTVVPIQPLGRRIPLFWIRGGARYRLLAQKLGSDQPFLGLDLPYSDARKLPVPFRLEDIAAFLIRALKEVQPEGPYAIAGLCVNAVIAYEVARQLKAAGDEIALLALLDGHNRAYYKHPLRDGRYTARLKFHLSNLVRLDVRERSAYMLARLDEAFRKVERAKWQLTPDDSEGDAAQRYNTDPFVHPAFHRYEPGSYPGKVVLFQSSHWPNAPYFDFRLGWEDLVEDIDFHRIPGTHPGMFTEPNVSTVADKLTAYLKKLPNKPGLL